MALKSNGNTYAKLSLFFASLTILSTFYLQQLFVQNTAITFVESTLSSFAKSLKLIIPFSLLLGMVCSALSLRKKETWKFWKRFAVILNLLLVAIVLGSVIFMLSTNS